MAPQGYGQMPHSAGAVPGSAGGYQSQTSSDGGWALVFEIGRDPAWLRKGIAKCPTVLEESRVAQVNITVQITSKVVTVHPSLALVDTRAKLAVSSDWVSSLKSDEGT
jgi:hypothetical protein